MGRTARRKLSICERDHWHCVYCFRYLGNAKRSDITLDHVFPENKYVDGSKRWHANDLVLSCLACNRRKAATPVEIFLNYNVIQLQYIWRQLSIPLRSLHDDFGAFNWETLNNGRTHRSGQPGA